MHSQQQGFQTDAATHIQAKKEVSSMHTLKLARLGFFGLAFSLETETYIFNSGKNRDEIIY